ncbi:MAG: polymorphic toxin-type HINT domain-containing protein [Flavobacterium sp.]|uniref:polymorphic toxin-type HINT domain-containing protein n=1 Tax=Flavobacterium sp. TaxID=239 RepID=UPI002617D979|nr:polymorphic toxin-type HINT domain-containing protein [Flavobacterium sp.]MDD5151507.1 polymorphic toxin-type HINT domain-containing protein [Flavobacterium sp.]
MKEDKSIYKELSDERKQLQNDGKLPLWVTTGGWQVLKDKYLTPEYPDLFSAFNRITKQAAKYLPENIRDEWEQKFFNILWEGYFGLASPVLSNMGMPTGCAVSCSGGSIGDSVIDFYLSQMEAATLTQNGFGTSGYLGNIRPRGSKITNSSAKASGILPVFKDFVQMSQDISQGSTRRGAWAGYVEIEHDDFYELTGYIKNNPEDANIGWIIKDSFIERLDNGDTEALGRFQEALYLKMLTGKGYFFFIDKVNRANPEMYKKHGLEVKASNLCLKGDTLIDIEYLDGSQTTLPISELVKDFPFYKKFGGDTQVLKVKTYKDGKIFYSNITNAGMTGKVSELVHIQTSDNKLLECTSNHLIYVKNVGWLEAINLMQDDILITDTGEVYITDIKLMSGYDKEPVYDLTVPETESFFANGILVHNCTEIALFSDEEHTFSCIISSMNLASWDKWKDTDAIFVATVFLDCVVSDFLETAKDKPGLEKVINFTKKGRAIGLGVMGFHTYLQEHMIPFDSIETNYFNTEVFKKLQEETTRASKWLAEILGEPEWCIGYGERNTHKIAVAPTITNALISGGVSQGVEPIYKNTFTQATASGDVDRVNPKLLEIMKQRKVYNKENIKDIVLHHGSIQHVDWLDDFEKTVFKTAFEVSQEKILWLAESRQKYIDQAQSINLFLSSEAKEEYIAYLHELAFKMNNLKALYYIRSSSGVLASTGDACTNCVA